MACSERENFWVGKSSIYPSRRLKARRSMSKIHRGSREWHSLFGERLLEVFPMEKSSLRRNLVDRS
jgi:hypothetical protein